MRETEIKFNTINDIQEFVNLAGKNEGEVTLYSSIYVINGKSLAGILSLDLSKPIKLVVDSPINREFVGNIEKFIVQ